MKKIVGLGLILAVSFGLAGCGDSGTTDKSSSNSSAKTEESSSVSSSVAESSTQESKAEVSGDFVPTAADATFDGTILKGNAYSVRITDHKVIQPGETGNEYGEAPVIAFWYDTLVSPDYDNSMPVNPTTAWISNFKAIQDNDPNMVNELNVASLPDQAHLDTQSAEIKPGGTLANSVAYELTDDSTPVTLVAGDFSSEFGRADFAIK
ncbi:DUF5067 domain-containing protein [Enterococcus asini]|uniref:DUF5067 domain-containing protein n=1 Tax=Enterococcus asini TaxID=57732 RepID=UPI00288DBBC5|nr:DUF5067 domain-containing protein [Enterococcus asini]MDT2756941.1 DUF5067 domain-containing protein [Enterococcus asini]